MIAYTFFACVCGLCRECICNHLLKKSGWLRDEQFGREREKKYCTLVHPDILIQFGIIPETLLPNNSNRLGCPLRVKEISFLTYANMTPAGCWGIQNQVPLLTCRNIACYYFNPGFDTARIKVTLGNAIYYSICITTNQTPGCHTRYIYHTHAHRTIITKYSGLISLWQNNRLKISFL